MGLMPRREDVEDSSSRRQMGIFWTLMHFVEGYEDPRGLTSTVPSERVEILRRLEEKSMNLIFDLTCFDLARA